jgi:hypothetical protein
MVGLKTKLLALCLLSTSAYGNENNEAMKTCLLAHGYDGSIFLMYNFEKAAGCYHDWKSGQLREEYIQSKLWLEEHPWYTGSNWNWEEIQKEYPGKRTITRW